MGNIKKKDDPAGLIFVGFVMIGMAIGFLLDQLVVGLFFGLGIGFIGMFIAKIALEKNKK